MSATRLLHRTLKFRLYPTPEQDLRFQSWYRNQRTFPSPPTKAGQADDSGGQQQLLSSEAATAIHRIGRRLMTDCKGPHHD